MTALGSTGTPSVQGRALRSKPLSRKERIRRRRRRRRARARARAQARARAAAARRRAAEEARRRAAEAARKQQAAQPAATAPTSADRHMIDRFSHGYTPELAREVAAAGGGRKWFERQLAWQSIADPATAIDTQAWWPHLLLDAPAQAKAHTDKVRYTWEVGFDLGRRAMARKILSTRQVHEVMSDFWLNHLYVPAGEDRSGVHRADYEATIRSHALGTFREMLKATTVHPCMTGFLTNFQNTRQALNENLGRELLELHTVGVGAGYDEDDVKDSARLLTGFRMTGWPLLDAGYDTGKHWVGAVDVLGFKHANAAADGRPVLKLFLDHLARHERTAERLARKLCVRFVRDTPSASIVSAVKKAYLASDTDIKATLRALVAHPDFDASRKVKVRTPVEDVVATARALRIRPSKPTGDEGKQLATHLCWMSENIGYRIYTWPRPDGAPDVASAWDGPSRLLRTWENRYSLSGGWWGSTSHTRPATSAFAPTSWPQRLDEVVSHVGLQLTGVKPSAATVAAACATVVGRDASWQVRGLRKPGLREEWEYLSDWDLLRICGTLLNSPDQLLR